MNPYKSLGNCLTGKCIWILLLAAFSVVPVLAQEDKKEVRSGTSMYENGKYNAAELEFRKALEKNETSYAGTYNLGSSLYRQDKQTEAITQYNAAVQRATTPDQRSMAYHNLGNALVKAEKYDEAVEAYKNALKLNPKDNDTRYNLSYAQSKLRQQQQQQQQENKEGDKDGKEKKQDQQQKESDKQGDQKENKGENGQEKPQQKQGDGKPQPKISKEDAERILQALKNNEQELNKKLSKKEGVRVNVEKNW
jgi:Ca-activated chloride channel family protein